MSDERSLDQPLTDRRDGGYEWFLAQGLPEYDGKGNIVKWYGSCTNIDAQRRARDRGAPA